MAPKMAAKTAVGLAVCWVESLAVQSVSPSAVSWVTTTGYWMVDWKALHWGMLKEPPREWRMVDQMASTMVATMAAMMAARSAAVMAALSVDLTGDARASTTADSMELRTVPTMADPKVVVRDSTTVATSAVQTVIVMG
jgi:hypothetical protein